MALGIFCLRNGVWGGTLRVVSASRACDAKEKNCGFPFVPTPEEMKQIVSKSNKNTMIDCGLFIKHLQLPPSQRTTTASAVVIILILPTAMITKSSLADKKGRPREAF